MAYYFITAALAAVATLSSAVPIEDGNVSKPKGFPSDIYPPFYNSCPNPNWADIKEYHTYPFEYNVQWYWNCGHNNVLEICPEGKVFNQKYHYCDHENPTSKSFVCPPFEHTLSGHRLFPDPNFKYQYHKCYDNNKYPSDRMACPYGQIFDESGSTCVYVSHKEERK